MTTEQPPILVEVPHLTAIPAFQKWRSFGTGVGIEVGPQDLFVTLSTVRPGGIKVLDTLQILRYRERPAAEWGEDYQQFLKRHKVAHVSAAVVLPANDCISRVIALPGVPDKELSSAVQYQLDGLHPFADEEAAHAFGRLLKPRQFNVSVAIAKNAVIEDYATLFDEAGIPVISFLTPAAAIYSAIRVLQLAPAAQFIATHEDEVGLLVYGESDSHPLYCVLFPGGSDRAVSAAASQMRLPEDVLNATLASLLPEAARNDVGGPVSYAASLVSAVPSQAIAVNLLPASRRKTSSPLRWVPTIILMVLLMALGLAFAYYQDYENRKLLEKLDAEIARLQPRVQSVNTINQQIEAATKRLQFLAELAAYPQQDLDSLRELTRLMPMSAYVSRLDLTRTEVGIVGEIDQSLELLRMLDSSPFFKDSEFTSAPGRTPLGKELFQIRSKRELPSVAAPPQPGPGAPIQPPVNSTPLPKIAPPPPLPQGLRP